MYKLYKENQFYIKLYIKIISRYLKIDKGYNQLISKFLIKSIIFVKRNIFKSLKNISY